MTRDEARDRAHELNAEHPERGRFRWLARETGGDWQVVRMTIPGGVRVDPLKNAVESRPQPNPAEDPRSSYDKNVGGPWVGGI
jgi:hypothetical protein